jgi:hypothetical protein
LDNPDLSAPLLAAASGASHAAALCASVIMGTTPNVALDFDHADRRLRGTCCEIVRIRSKQDLQTGLDVVFPGGKGNIFKIAFRGMWQVRWACVIVTARWGARWLGCARKRVLSRGNLVRIVR